MERENIRACVIGRDPALRVFRVAGMKRILWYIKNICQTVFIPVMPYDCMVSMMTCGRPAKLAKAPLGEIKDLEEKLGVTLVAFEKVPAYKKMTPAAIARLKAAEKETGAILVAYEA